MNQENNKSDTFLKKSTAESQLAANATLHYPLRCTEYEDKV